MRNFFEGLLERAMFSSRWALAPVYVALCLTLLVITYKVIALFIYEITHLSDLTLNELLVFVLHIVDLALVGNLVLMVIFAGYENFVSKIDIANQSEDKPEWMGKLDFSGLKLKLIASIVAISSIGLLEAFIDVGSKTSEEIYLMIFIHAVFILSGLVIAIMDYISGITKPVSYTHLRAHET